MTLAGCIDWALRGTLAPEGISRIRLSAPMPKVLEGFDVSSTRDGNVSQRFLGYARSKWAKYWDLDQARITSARVGAGTIFNPS